MHILKYPVYLISHFEGLSFRMKAEMPLWYISPTVADIHLSMLPTAITNSKQTPVPAPSLQGTLRTYVGALLIVSTVCSLSSDHNTSAKRPKVPSPLLSVRSTSAHLTHLSWIVCSTLLVILPRYSYPKRSTDGLRCSSCYSCTLRRLMRLSTQKENRRTTWTTSLL